MNKIKRIDFIYSFYLFRFLKEVNMKNKNIIILGIIIFIIIVVLISIFAYKISTNRKY